MSRMKQVIDALEAERDELVDRLRWVERQIKEFRRRDGDTATKPPARSNRRATARPSTARVTARARRGDTKQQILDYLATHPGSTAGDVAKGINANRNTVATRLSQLAKTGEITKAEKGYAAKR